jgi:hypothetical protein
MRSPENLAGAPQSNLLRQRCDARRFEPLPIEIVAKRKVALAFEPQKDRRAGSRKGEKRSCTGLPQFAGARFCFGDLWFRSGSRSGNSLLSFVRPLLDREKTSRAANGPRLIWVTSIFDKAPKFSDASNPNRLLKKSTEKSLVFVCFA